MALGLGMQEIVVLFLAVVLLTPVALVSVLLVLLIRKELRKQREGE